MNKTLIKWTLILLLCSVLIMAFTGLSFVFGVKSEFLGVLHEITGIVFLAIIVVHIITFRRVLRTFVCPVRSKK